MENSKGVPFFEDDERSVLNPFFPALFGSSSTWLVLASPVCEGVSASSNAWAPGSQERAQCEKEYDMIVDHAFSCFC